jgi:hypothetical protein
MKRRKSAKDAPGMYGKEAKAKKAADKFAHEESVRAALAFARFHGRGAKWSIRNGDFLPSVTRNVLQKALDGELKYCNGERKNDSILTELETKELIKWIQDSAKNTNPAIDSEVSEKVINILRCRWAFNVKKRHSKFAGCVPLTDAEMRLVRTPNAEVSHTWLQNFQARSRLVADDGVGVGPKGVRNADATRTKKQNEGVVEQHFHGVFGVEAELIDMGIMDPETKVRVHAACSLLCAPACSLPPACLDLPRRARAQRSNVHMREDQFGSGTSLGRSKQATSRGAHVARLRASRRRPWHSPTLSPQRHWHSLMRRLQIELLVQRLTSVMRGAGSRGVGPWLQVGWGCGLGVRKSDEHGWVVQDSACDDLSRGRVTHYVSRVARGLR